MSAKIVHDPVVIARLFLFVRELEGQNNRGLRVEAIQHWSRGQFGDSWCDEFIQMVLDIAYAGDSPFPRETDIDDACEATLAYAQNQGWVLPAEEQPTPGDLVVFLDEELRAHHIAMYTGQLTPEGHSLGPLPSPEYCVIAGNTSADGASHNGDRVAEHAVSATDTLIIRYPR